MKISRNQPCPCGSGIKYKKCCMDKEASVPKLKPQVPKLRRLGSRFDEDKFDDALDGELGEVKEKDPVFEAREKAYEEFEQLETEEKPRFFLQMLEEHPERIDAENAFHMLETIFSRAQNQERKEQVIPLFDQLESALPDVYNHDRHYYLSWKIEVSLNLGDYEDCRENALAFAALAGEHIDEYFRVIEQLMFHNQLQLVIEMMRIACPIIKDSDKVMPGAFYEAAENALCCELFLFLEKNPDRDSLAPEFLETLDYTEFEVEFFCKFARELFSQEQREWTLEELQMPKPPRERDDGLYWDDEPEEEAQRDPGRDNLEQLSYQFLRYLREEEELPSIRGETARKQLISYLVQRHREGLMPQKSIFETSMQPRRRKKAKKKKRQQRTQLKHPLVPDNKTMDVFLGQKMSFLAWRHYEAFSFFEVIPAWLRFLETLGLLDEEQHRQTLADLRPLLISMEQIAEKRKDPLLAKSLQAWLEPLTADQ